jgi:hypothetical protein
VSNDRAKSSTEAENIVASSTDDMSAEEKRHDQLITAPKSTERDAAPRIDVTEDSDGPTRIDVRDDAIVRPGKTTGREEKS